MIASISSSSLLVPPLLHPSRSLSLHERKHKTCRFLSLVRSGTWQEVQDPASGRPYYWNTRTNETSWEKPELLAVEGGDDLGPASSDASLQPAALSQQQMLESLQQALQADGSGMQFWETARSHRKDGVFESGFSDFLAQQIEAASDDGARGELRKLQARLCNPLLKQAAPFEFRACATAACGLRKAHAHTCNIHLASQSNATWY